MDRSEANLVMTSVFANRTFLEQEQVNTYLRVLLTTAVLGLNCLGMLLCGGRLLRASFGNVWLLRWGPKLVYSFLLMIGLPWILVVWYGAAGLFYYLISGALLAVVSFLGWLNSVRQ